MITDTSPVRYNCRSGTSEGCATSRAIGWGDRAVVFRPVLTIRGAWAAENFYRWEAERGGKRWAAYPEMDGDEVVSWVCGSVHGLVEDLVQIIEASHHDSLEAALYAARDHILEGA